MNVNDYKRGLTYDKDENLEEHKDLNMQGFISRLSTGDITPKYEVKIKRIELENSSLEEKIKEALQEEM